MLLSMHTIKYRVPPFSAQILTNLYGKSMVDYAAVCRHPLQTMTEFYRSTELIHVTYRIFVYVRSTLSELR